MNNYIDIQGDLYNRYLCINSVSRVRYQQRSDDWTFVIYLTDEDAKNNYHHRFDTEYEAESYRREFVAKVMER